MLLQNSLLVGSSARSVSNLHFVPTSHRFHWSKLRSFRRSFERRGRRFATGDRLLDRVEITGTDEPLVLHRFVSLFALGREFCVLKFAIRAHAGLLVFVREVEHAV